jgi:hypothetical protein
LRDHQRVDLQHRRIERREGAVAGQDGLGRLFDLGALEAQREGDLASLKGLHADGGLDRLADDALRLARRDLLDFHAARRGRDDHHPFGFSVEHEAQIDLLGDGGRLLDIEAIDGLSLRPGLVGDQSLAQQLRCRVPHLVRVAAELDPAGLAAGPGVNLSLDDPALAADLLSPVAGLLGTVGQAAARHRDAEPRQELLGLIFMNIHRPSPTANRPPVSTFLRREVSRRGLCCRRDRNTFPTTPRPEVKCSLFG